MSSRKRSEAPARWAATHPAHATAARSSKNATAVNFGYFQKYANMVPAGNGLPLKPFSGLSLPLGFARRRLLNEPLDRPTLSTKTISIAMIALGVAGISIL